MSDRGATPSGARELPLLLGPGSNAPEMLLMIGTPGTDGVVHVRVWSAHDWSAPPRARAERATAFLQWLEDQSTAGRTMNQSLYALRMWLRSEGQPAR